MKECLLRLERSRYYWFFIGILFVFFLLRLPSLVEPYWYGDEGIYETVGFALTKGRTLYTQIWDNKPPLLYSTYALFQGNQFTVRLFSLIVGLITVGAFYLLAYTLFKHIKPVVFSSMVFALLFGLPLFEGNIANAENFMLVFSIFAGFLIYQAATDRKNHRLFLAGILLGIAFLYKIVAIFDFFAFFTFLLISFLPQKLTPTAIKLCIKEHFRDLALLTSGFIVPFFMSVLYFGINGALSSYIHAVFVSTVGYVGYKNAFIIPQGLLLAKVILLILFVLVLFNRRNQFSPPVIFIALWTAFSLFNSFFSQRPYTHYLLLLIPSYSLIVGGIVHPKTKYKKYTVLVIAIIIALMTITYFNNWGVKKTIGYYVNYIAFTMGYKSVAAYEAFFDRRTPRDAEIARFIARHQKKPPSLFVWGNAAQLYFLTKTLPPGRFTVAYHIQSRREYLQETVEALRRNQPQFIILTRDASFIPFPLYNYTHVVTIQDADIYERNN